MPTIPYPIGITGTAEGNWIKLTNRTTGKFITNYLDSNSQAVFDLANMDGEVYLTGDVIEAKEVGTVNGETTHTVNTTLGIGVITFSSTAQSSEGFSL